MTASRTGAVALCVYAVVGLADTGLHLRQPVDYGMARYAPERIIVAADAGLYWPADLVAAALLADR